MSLGRSRAGAKGPSYTHNYTEPDIAAQGIRGGQFWGYGVFGEALDVYVDIERYTPGLK